MKVSFLCSMLRDDLNVFLESDDNTLMTTAGRLYDNESEVKDYQFMNAEGIIIWTKGC